jgi:hypothetical protein
VVIQKNATLTVSAPGPVNFKSLRIMQGGTLQSAPSNSPATVNVSGQVITETSVFITDIHLNIASAQGDVFGLFNNSTLTRTVVNAPSGTCHSHTGSQLLACSEFCCRNLDIEPTRTDVCRTETPVCACPEGFEFEQLGTGEDSCTGTTPGLTCTDYRRCVKID